MKETGVRFWSGVELSLEEEGAAIVTALQAVQEALPPELRYRSIIKYILASAIDYLDYSALDVTSSVEADEEPEQ